MDHLANVSIDDLQDALDDVTAKTPAQRLIAAIAYKHGVSQSALASWFGVERKTIYNWLTRLDQGDLVDAVHDDDRPGRPRKLSAEQFDALVRALRRPPSVAGYAAPAWTTRLVQEFLRHRWHVEYSRPSCRRFMRSAGLSYHPSLDAATESAADDERDRPEEEEAREEETAGYRHGWLPT